MGLAYPNESLRPSPALINRELRMIDMQSSVNPDDEQIERVGKIIHAATNVTPSRREICDIIRAILITRPPLTECEVKVFDALKEHYRNERHAITMRGLREKAGRRSIGDTHRIVNNLCDKGYAIQLAGKYLPVNDKIGLIEPER